MIAIIIYHGKLSIALIVIAGINITGDIHLSAAVGSPAISDNCCELGL
jgi:hypothetical protein